MNLQMRVSDSIMSKNWLFGNEIPTRKRDFYLGIWNRQPDSGRNRWLSQAPTNAKEMFRIDLPVTAVAVEMEVFAKSECIYFGRLNLEGIGWFYSKVSNLAMCLPEEPRLELHLVGSMFCRWCFTYRWIFAEWPGPSCWGFNGLHRLAICKAMVKQVVYLQASCMLDITLGENCPFDEECFLRDWKCQLVHF